MEKILDWGRQNRAFIVAAAMAATFYLLYSNDGLGLVAASLILASIALLVCIQQYKYEKALRLVLHRISPVGISCRELLGHISKDENSELAFGIWSVDVRVDINDFLSHGSLTPDTFMTFPTDLMIEFDSAKILMLRVKEFVDDMVGDVDSDEVSGLRSWLEKLVVSIAKIETYAT